MTVTIINTLIYGLNYSIQLVMFEIVGIHLFTTNDNKVKPSRSTIRIYFTAGIPGKR